MAHDMHEKEMVIKVQNDRKMAREKKRRREMEIEKAAKLEEQRQQVQKFFDEEQLALRAKLETLHLADEKKQKAQVSLSYAKRAYCSILFCWYLMPCGVLH